MIKINDAAFQKEMLKECKNDITRLKERKNNGILNKSDFDVRLSDIKFKIVIIKKGYYP